VFPGQPEAQPRTGPATDGELCRSTSGALYLQAGNSANLPRTYFERIGLPVQNRVLGRDAFIGIYRTEIGNVNEVIHLWRYADAQERATKRALLYQDAEFWITLTKVREMITHQHVRLAAAGRLQSAHRRLGGYLDSLPARAQP